jgi:hypothetical protein
MLPKGRTHRKHITGATAIAQLREVLAGGYAPGAPRPVRK